MLLHGLLNAGAKEGKADSSHSNTKAFTSGMISRSFAVGLLVPFAVVKTRYESLARADLPYRGTIHAIKEISMKEGVRGRKYSASLRS